MIIANLIVSVLAAILAGPAVALVATPCSGATGSITPSVVQEEIGPPASSLPLHKAVDAIASGIAEEGGQVLGWCCKPGCGLCIEQCSDRNFNCLRYAIFNTCCSTSKPELVSLTEDTVGLSARNPVAQDVAPPAAVSGSPPLDNTTDLVATGNVKEDDNKSTDLITTTDVKASKGLVQLCCRPGCISCSGPCSWWSNGNCRWNIMFNTCCAAELSDGRPNNATDSNARSPAGQDVAPPAAISSPAALDKAADMIATDDVKEDDNDTPDLITTTDFKASNGAVQLCCRPGCVVCSGPCAWSNGNCRWNELSGDGRPNHY
ncbi:hypothetical protein B0H63DRAFT_521424 [Podospora didyma]|uniref:Uncharacterized protein n=1 Tax=Podospora didyma TaxID=330526 RepID=A0AAE0U1A9_9PEZI|nr:hypothetical protein B0H63DRAFT_521424 [Podospora didyma]